MYIASTRTWYLERIIRLIAGLFIMASVALGFTVSPKWFYFSGLVGGMLTVFALTGFCPLGIVLHLAGARERCSC